jgi:hypothetical protein
VLTGHGPLPETGGNLPYGRWNNGMLWPGAMMMQMMNAGYAAA